MYVVIAAILAGAWGFFCYMVLPSEMVILSSVVGGMLLGIGAAMLEDWR